MVFVIVSLARLSGERRDNSRKYADSLYEKMNRERRRGAKDEA